MDLICKLKKNNKIFAIIFTIEIARGSYMSLIKAISIVNNQDQSQFVGVTFTNIKKLFLF